MNLIRQKLLSTTLFRSIHLSKPAGQGKIWEDPWKNATPEQTKTYTEVAEANVDWSLVERLMPIETIPPMPQFDDFSPSGWKSPSKNIGDLKYCVIRRRDHMFPLYLERRRDKLNEKTMDFEYVEIVALRHVSGDVFACEKDLKSYLEEKVGHPIATNVDEIKGIIKIKGADRSLVEKFLYEKGF
uniref:Large ribosomal subunit protein mL49 n=1 Tax=Parastrongyloides trichosuri TaxID=131310 RepID=A0A0N4Z0E5_PARTI